VAHAHLQEDERKTDVPTGFSFLQRSKITHSTYNSIAIGPLEQLHVTE
jgi:hypothetical protein